MKSLDTKYLDIVLFKTWADLRAEASRAYIGFLWWFIEPILYMAAFYLLFGMGLRLGGEGYVYFLLCGLVSWKWFSSTLANGSRAIEGGAGMINQVYLPKILLPTIIVLVNTVKFGFMLPLLMLFLVLSGFTVEASWLALIPLMLVQFALVWSLTAFLAAVVPFLPDLRYVIENGLLMMMFLSGVFYSIGDLSPPVRDVLYLNPMALLLDAYRAVLIEGAWPAISGLAYSLAFSLFFGVIAAWLLIRFDRRYPKVI